tara:strand:- start:3958 stop:4689 length:732 start_codon:yes stop_codon:yes gene_type:complete
MNELTELGKKHGTDKAGPQHNYTEAVYYPLLKGMKHQNINLLELGVGDTGASVKMWREFFPNANIILFDPFFIIHEAVTVTAKELEELGVIVHKGNQLSREDLLKMALSENEKFDVIIDDASHLSDGMQISLATLFPYLKDGGLYIIEDLSTARSRDSRLDDVNAWLNGPDVELAQDKKLYHRQEAHVLDSLAAFRTSQAWTTELLSDEEKKYLAENILDYKVFRDYNGQENLVVIKKKKEIK